MLYEFPIINHINDLLPAISGDKSFITADRGDHVVINYVIAGPETFPSINVNGGSAKMRAERLKNNVLRRECRGIIFDKVTGKIIRRPLHKFFNLLEREETQTNEIDFYFPHTIFEKLDGSFIAPYKTSQGRFYVGTKMGNTDVATGAEQFMSKHVEYVRLSNELINEGYTPVFEWMTRQQRIVIDHPVDRLVLIAVRHMVSGEYLDLSDISPHLTI